MHLVNKIQLHTALVSSGAVCCSQFRENKTKMIRAYVWVLQNQPKELACSTYLGYC